MNVIWPSVMVIKGLVQILPGMCRVPAEVEIRVFKRLKENILTLQFPLTQLENCFICLFHLFAIKIFWKVLSISESSYWGVILAAFLP